jgi:hypothetical protein
MRCKCGDLLGSAQEIEEIPDPIEARLSSESEVTLDVGD